MTSPRTQSTEDGRSRWAPTAPKRNATQQVGAVCSASRGSFAPARSSNGPRGARRRRRQRCGSQRSNRPTVGRKRHCTARHPALEGTQCDARAHTHARARARNTRARARDDGAQTAIGTAPAQMAAQLAVHCDRRARSSLRVRSAQHRDRGRRRLGSCGLHAPLACPQARHARGQWCA
jgi:hypothetical protein